ncbi:hypothetical protein L2E82_52170 [Cichorium intybus]|nr:hypothetical protein L2E82_52170 [Cichorium intybus]
MIAQSSLSESPKNTTAAGKGIGNGLPLGAGTLMAITDWFRDYKIPDGKTVNKFGLGDKAANKVEDDLQNGVANVVPVPSDEIKKQVLLFATSNDLSKVAQTFVDVARLFKGKLIFVYVEMDNEDVGKPVGDYFGITGDVPHNDDDVKIVVGKNFEYIVFDESKDVLLEVLGYC